MTEQGQTAVEYVLMLLVVSALVSGLMGRVRDWLLQDIKDCKQSSSSLTCRVNNQFTMLERNKFRYFPLRR
ncbi:MAG: hypothetical protein HN353_13880 [Bdellovibrionales bacterium]|nr:hypothetical protein [Bdellovibrionales bacterium]MBT3526944.1 hypothetical protein [Bdellovibrionales bacterium]MBT7669696.1 hypothetical protein [Bdellovibrionales bacterium]MBT7767478.1 hypothetical protein [Bdellovibrionales bacterium]